MTKAMVEINDSKPGASGAFREGWIPGITWKPSVDFWWVLDRQTSPWKKCNSCSQSDRCQWTGTWCQGTFVIASCSFITATWHHCLLHESTCASNVSQGGQGYYPFHDPETSSFGQGAEVSIVNCWIACLPQGSQHSLAESLTQCQFSTYEMAPWSVKPGCKRRPFFSRFSVT